MDVCLRKLHEAITMDVHTQQLITSFHTRSKGISTTWALRCQTTVARNTQHQTEFKGPYMRESINPLCELILVLLETQHYLQVRELAEYISSVHDLAPWQRLIAHPSRSSEASKHPCELCVTMLRRQEQTVSPWISVCERPLNEWRIQGAEFAKRTAFSHAWHEGYVFGVML